MAMICSVGNWWLKKPMDKQQWTDYWSGGSLHSLSADYSGNYTGIIEAFWREQFTELKAGARILDVATGNGAIALHALSVSDEQNKAFEVSACDLADINPLETVQDEALKLELEKIRFHSQVNVERTNFPSDSFEFISSQFGLEYADLEKAISEVSRLLSRGGKVAAMLHHPESYILRTTKQDKLQCDRLLDEYQLFEVAKELIEKMGDVSSPERRAEMVQESEVLEARDRLNQTVQKINRASQDLKHPELTSNTLKALQSILVQLSQASLAQRLAPLETIKGQIISSRERIEDLLGAAINDKRKAQITNALSAVGMKVKRFEPVVDEYKDIVGWALIATKPE